jgi:pimeloyl-ACP methyl ester carboxylesterase
MIFAVTVPVGELPAMSLREEPSEGMMSESTSTSFVTASGYRLHLRHVAGGKCGLPTLVFLHEGLGTIEMWGDIPEAVCRGTGCPGLIYERPGYGASSPRPLPWPDDIFEQESEIVLPALLDQVGIDRPVLIGHSDGGTIALMCAAACPERVRGVVTLAAHVVLDELTLTGLQALERSWREGDLRAELERFHGPAADLLFRGWSGLWLDPARRDWSIVDRLPRITCPVLAIQGADDEYGLPAQLDARGPLSLGGPPTSLRAFRKSLSPQAQYQDLEHHIALGCPWMATASLPILSRAEVSVAR